MERHGYRWLPRHVDHRRERREQQLAPERGSSVSIRVLVRPADRHRQNRQRGREEGVDVVPKRDDAARSRWRLCTDSTCSGLGVARVLGERAVDRLEHREIVHADGCGTDLPDADEVLDQLAALPRRRRIDDVVPEIREQRGGVTRRALRTRDRQERRSAASSSRQSAGAPAPALPPRGTGAPARARRTCRRLVAGHHVEQRGRVAHRARDRAGRAEAERAGAVRRGGFASARRLDPEEAAARRGNADRAAAVASVRGGCEARGDGRGGAAARAAGCARTSHGLRHTPLRSDSVCAIVPNSGVFVLPSTTKPALRILRTTAASFVGT